jgi:hypothetical protein
VPRRDPGEPSEGSGERNPHETGPGLHPEAAAALPRHRLPLGSRDTAPGAPQTRRGLAGGGRAGDWSSGRSRPREGAGAGRRRKAAGAVQMGKAGKLRGREGACGRPGGLRTAPPLPSSCAAASALGGSGGRGDAGTRGPGSGPARLGTRDSGRAGLSPGKGAAAARAGGDAGSAPGFFPTRSFVEVAVFAARSPPGSPGVQAWWSMAVCVDTRVWRGFSNLEPSS